MINPLLMNLPAAQRIGYFFLLKMHSLTREKYKKERRKEISEHCSHNTGCCYKHIYIYTHTRLQVDLPWIKALLKVSCSVSNMLCFTHFLREEFACHLTSLQL